MNQPNQDATIETVAQQKASLRHEDKEAIKQTILEMAVNDNSICPNAQGIAEELVNAFNWINRLG